MNPKDLNKKTLNIIKINWKLFLKKLIFSSSFISSVNLCTYSYAFWLPKQINLLNCTTIIKSDAFGLHGGIIGSRSSNLEIFKKIPFLIKSVRVKWNKMSYIKVVVRVEILKNDRIKNEGVTFCISVYYNFQFFTASFIFL